MPAINALDDANKRALAVAAIQGDVHGDTDAAGNLVFPSLYPVTFTYLENGWLGTATCTDGVTVWTLTYAYDASGNLTTVTATDGAATWVDTYTYVAGRLDSHTGWVQQ